MTYQLHRNTPHGRYVFMGDFETDFVTIAFKDCVSNHTGNYVWVTTSDREGYPGTLFDYDPDHHDYLDVDDWDLSIPELV